ncbi:MAG: energy-coupling factor transporter transmembrane protein EcfT [Calditrichaeota bacterium]|nr:energy-coupling factor transporter transmembrane protein EcfT [Calditrichota bacterium]
MVTPFGNYISGKTLPHRLDPRVKLVCTAMIFSAVLIIGKWIGLIPIAGISLVFCLISEQTLAQFVRDAISLSFLYIVTVALHSVLTPGDPLFSIAMGISVTVEGLEKGVFFAFKIVCLAILAGLILRTTHQAEWAKAIEDLLPERGKLGRFAVMFGLTIRFFPMILEEANRIRLAQIGRGLESGGNLIKRVRNLIPVTLPLLAASFRKADIISYNMQARGFRIDASRSRHKQTKFTSEDIITGLIVIATIILSFYLLFISA